MSDRPILADAPDAVAKQAEAEAAVTLRPLEDGTVLRERYRITNIVGRGGMGNVYRAEDLRLTGRLCAIKEVPPAPHLTAELQRQAQGQFHQEASILAQLDHPNLPKVSDYFTTHDRDYLVMDFVPGKDLKQLLDESRLRGRQLDVDTVMSWSQQILEAAAYLHHRVPPVVHRDIKPGNIKLTPDNRIKLVDFGLVKIMAGDESRTITVVQGRGTALYTPLEQYGGDSGHTDVRTDIYAIGATLYHLLTGTPPADAKARFLDPRILRPPSELNRQIPDYVSEATLWAMEMHPDDRPQNVEQLAEALAGGAGRPGVKRDGWGAALKSNWVALLAMILLLGLALVLTLN